MLAPGDAVSYGCTYRAPHAGRAATLTVGYADGHPGDTRPVPKVNTRHGR